MVRFKREISETGIYHVMTRGNAKNNIFIDNQDKGKYIKVLRQKKEESNFYIYAYCIMSNHSHLIIKERDKPISDIMKRINISYASYFNKKYNRVGHVFQDRYLSEPIEDDAYLVTAVRYIHNNPVKAKLVNECGSYLWSSYNDYLKNPDNCLVDVEFVLSLFSDDLTKSIKLFKSFSKKSNDDKLKDIDNIEEESKTREYEQAKTYVDEYLNTNNLKLEDLRKRKIKNKRNELILFLRNNSDLSIREIAALLQIGRNMVANAK